MLFYRVFDGKRNGAGVILKEELVGIVLEVKSVRQSDESEAGG